jgi:hypothetical protein
VHASKSRSTCAESRAPSTPSSLRKNASFYCMREDLIAVDLSTGCLRKCTTTARPTTAVLEHLLRVMAERVGASSPDYSDIAALR